MIFVLCGIALIIIFNDIAIEELKDEEMSKIYALYDGDNFVDVGTIKEIAERQGVKPETIRFYKSGVYARRRNINRHYLVEIEEDEEDGRDRRNGCSKQTKAK